MLRINRCAPAISLSPVTEDPRPRLLLGSFDAEREWEDADTLSMSRWLPKQPDTSVLALDELLFLFCRSGDAVLTIAGKRPEYVAYLSHVGFTPRFISASHLIPTERPAEPLSIYECLDTSEAESFIRDVVRSYVRFVPYAVTPDAERFWRRHSVPESLPDSRTVRAANSKAWSNELRDSLGCPLGRTVTSAAALWENGATLLESGAVIVKEEFGVAGRGSVVINSLNTLRSVCERVGKAEARGLRVLFVVEPYVEKSFDFSCHFFVGEGASEDAAELMGMTNRGNAYVSSHPLTPSQREKILATDYLKVIGGVSVALGAIGYRGPACVDSLVTKTGEVVPILEVNARLSMGLMNLFLCRHLEKTGLSSYLTQLRLSATRVIRFSEVLGALERAGLLHLPGGTGGVIPLSAGAVEFGSESSHTSRPHRPARFACCVPYGTLDEVEPVLAATRDVLTGLGYQVLS